MVDAASALRGRSRLQIKLLGVPPVAEVSIVAEMFNRALKILEHAFLRSAPNGDDRFAAFSIVSSGLFKTSSKVEIPAMCKTYETFGDMPLICRRSPSFPFQRWTAMARRIFKLWMTTL